ncbi:MAG: zinc ribbon domain-containing protein [Bacilli bacterium]|nr:zinc ribbon domain-containing protein [Bacilli bacterium]
MYCTKCGKETKSGNFCQYCGQPLNNQQFTPPETNKKEIAGLIIGIISLVFNFVLFFISIPLSIIGIIISKKAKKETNKTNAGLIMNIISLVLSIIELLITIVIVVIFGLAINALFSHDFSLPEKTAREKQETYYKVNYDSSITDIDDLIGKWNCYNPSRIGDYKLTLELKNNNKYKIGDYNSYNKNYATGKYAITQKNNPIEYPNYSITYYNLVFASTEEYKINNKEHEEKAFDKKYSIGVIDNKIDKDTIIITDSRNTYYVCKIEGE